MFRLLGSLWAVRLWRGVGEGLWVWEEGGSGFKFGVGKVWAFWGVSVQVFQRFKFGNSSAAKERKMTSD